MRLVVLQIILLLRHEVLQVADLVLDLSVVQLDGIVSVWARPVLRADRAVLATIGVVRDLSVDLSVDEVLLVGLLRRASHLDADLLVRDSLLHALAHLLPHLGNSQRLTIIVLQEVLVLLLVDVRAEVLNELFGLL